MVFRNYSSTLGKWLSRDPIGEMGGTNLSSYVMNAPASFIDPLGLAKNPRDMTCQELADEIGRLNDELINRNNAMGKNKNNLPVDDTHGVVFGNVQSRIRDLLGEFASRPCNQDLPADVWKWATCPKPKPNQHPERDKNLPNCLRRGFIQRWPE